MKNIKNINIKNMLLAVMAINWYELMISLESRLSHI